MRKMTSLMRTALSLCLALLLVTGTAGAESLFPSPDELFGVTEN